MPKLLTGMQSSNRETTLFNVNMSHYWYICVFSVRISLETNAIIETTDFIHRIPFARAACWNRTCGMPRCSRSSRMSGFSINVSWMMLNIIVCKQKSISLTVFEKWELENCLVRSVIQCIQRLCHWQHNRDLLNLNILIKLHEFKFGIC